MPRIQHAVMNGERREHSRVKLKTSIGFGSDSNFYTGFTRDISEGGLFVATYNLMPVGTEIDLEFSLPDSDRPIAVRGQVRWIAEHNELSDGSPGLGVKFLDLAAPDQRRIEKFVRVRESMFYED